MGVLVSRLDRQSYVAELTAEEAPDDPWSLLGHPGVLVQWVMCR